jgi:predicted dehydrogenase
MSPSDALTRRNFAARAGVWGLGLGLPTIVSASALGREDRPPPSERLTLGFIGVGIQNFGHLRSFLRRPAVEVVAVCDVDSTRRDVARHTVQQTYADAGRSGSPSCDAYHDYHDLLARDDIDAVVVATPDHWHASIVIDACKAGKDIYCEKPLSLTIREARLMTEAVRKYDRVFQTGSQQRTEYGGRFRRACEYVRSGRIGRVQTVHVGIGGPSRWCDLPGDPPEPGLDWDFWLGPAPERPYNSILSPRGVHRHFPDWRSYREYSGGGYTDFGAHHLDIAQWGLNRDDSGPVEIIPPEDPRAQRGAKYIYADGVEMFHGGPSGVTFVGTNGLIQVDRGRLSSVPESIVRDPSSDSEVHLPQAKSHHDDWLDCIKSRKRPICDVEIGARSVTVCHLGNLAYWNHCRLRWDPIAWRFVDGYGSNTWLDREHRHPYGLPSV